MVKRFKTLKPIKQLAKNSITIERTCRSVAFRYCLSHGRVENLRFPRVNLPKRYDVKDRKTGSSETQRSRADTQTSGYKSPAPGRTLPARSTHAVKRIKYIVNNLLNLNHIERVMNVA